MTGEQGSVAIQIKLAPLWQPLVQQLIVPVPPAPGSALADVIDVLVGAISVGLTDWPAGIAVADGFGLADALRRLRLASAWTGRCRIDSYLAGSGETTATVRLAGATGAAVVAVDIAAGDGPLARLAVSLAR